jgi:hypothetical protein
MRKLFAIAVMALAALAVAAPSASAMDPGPPYGTDSGDWTGVYVSDAAQGGDCHPAPLGWCNGEGAMYSWSLVTEPMVSTYNTLRYCTAPSVEDAFDSDGSFEVRYSYFYGNQGYDCGSIYPQNAPWSGQMCVHVGTGEIWARQDFDVVVGWPGTPFAGESFGQVTVDASGFPSIEFDNAYIGSQGSYDYGQDGTYYSDSQITVEAAEAACSWPELQA